jgi:hypothetical protein
VVELEGARADVGFQSGYRKGEFGQGDGHLFLLGLKIAFKIDES